MPGGKFNLLDQPYWDALADVSEGLRTQGIDYAVVGGAAAQIWIAVLQTRRGLDSVTDAPDLQFLLRETRDIDLSTRAPSGDLLAALNRVAATSRPPVDVLSVRALRMRGVFVNLTLEPSDVSGFQDKYDKILERAVEVRLRRQNQVLHLRVESLEDLFGTKLTRKSNQAKDLLDLDRLGACLLDSGQKVSLAIVQEFLGQDDSLLNSYRSRFPGVLC